MNVLEKYALNGGVKYKNPSIACSYFPLICDKYVVIDNRNRNAVSTYDMYSDVISYIHPYLQKEGIELISFCEEKSIIERTKPYISLDKKQECYILKHSLLNICSDNLSSYLSDALGVPSIGLYSAFPAQLNKPIWSDKHTVIESSRDGNLSSYGTGEKPKAINLIEPEVIAKSILSKLNIKHNIEWETIFIGDDYPTKIVEVIPDFMVDPSFMAKRALNIRMDYNFDEKILCNWLNNRYLNIIIDKPLKLDLLKYFKKNIAQVTVDLNDNFSNEYLKDVQEIGIKLEIFCDNKDLLNKYRFDFFDFNVEEALWKTKSDVEKELTENSMFLTGKILLSEGKKYSCYDAKKQGKELTSQPEPVYDTPSFWKELNHYRLINEKQVRTKRIRFNRGC